jgi:hypothetical protein
MLHQSRPRPDDGSRWFPILHGGPYTAIDWEAVARYRIRIEFNHATTLDRLAEEGGLDWYELWCAFHDRPLFPAVDLPIVIMREEVLAIVTRVVCSSPPP